MKFKFCPLCGYNLDNKLINGDEFAQYCIACKKPYFDNPSVCKIATVINEKGQVLLLKSNYISTIKWTLVAGYVNKEETLEDAVIREIMEETGQRVEELKYVRSYYFAPKELVMCGFIAWVNQVDFTNCNEVNDLFWCNINEVNKYINRENNLSGTHFDCCFNIINNN